VEEVTDPSLEDEGKFVESVEADELWAEDIEVVTFELEKEPPVDTAHEFGGDHVGAVGGRECLAG
jgi:hypothetical protein